jgi:hypothetical protein
MVFAVVPTEGLCHQEVVLYYFFFHKIFRLQLVLTPVSTSGKNSRIRFTVLYQKPLQQALDWNP